MAKVKKVSYPFWAAFIVLQSLFAIGYYYQEKTIMKDLRKRQAIDKFD